MTLIERDPSTILHCRVTLHEELILSRLMLSFVPSLKDHDCVSIRLLPKDCDV